MARESALWARVKAAAHLLRVAARPAHKIDLQRVENAVGVGHPDVEGCINGQQIWLELKSCARPKRLGSKLAIKTRPSQEVWHRQRSAAGFRHAWVLIQVGDGARATLYLIAGCDYDKLKGATESDLRAWSWVPPEVLCYDALTRAAEGWQFDF